MFEEVPNVVELAGKVASVAAGLGLNPQVRHIENPRMEMEEHYYRPDRLHLVDMGYQPTHDMEAELRLMLTDLLRYSRRIEEVKEVLLPRIRWDGSKRQSTYLD